MDQERFFNRKNYSKLKPVAIISTDLNPDYLFLLPIVAKSWELQGFAPRLIVDCEESDYSRIRNLLFPFLSPDATIYAGYNDPDRNIKSEKNKALYSQCCRLYAAGSVTVEPETYAIISDADMFIASSFLYRDFDKVNSFGHDLTDFQEIPACYVGMKAERWLEIFGNNMADDLRKYAAPDSDEWHKAWGCDQQILTGKLKEYGFNKINFINRGIDPKNLNLPLGRWDRYGGFKKPSGEIHDVHLMRDPTSEENFNKILDMCETVYPNENWGWLDKYRSEFLKEMRHAS